MSRLVTLKIGDGDFDRGFPAILRIGSDGRYPEAEIDGWLPPAPRMPEAYRDWQSKYNSDIGLGSMRDESGDRSNPRALKAPPDLLTNSSIQELQKQLEQAINEWLKSGDRQFEAICKRLWALSESGNPLRVVIQTDKEELWRLPWHLWEVFEHNPRAEVAVSPSKYELPEIQPLQAKKKVKVLAILGNSKGIDVEADRHLLEQIASADTVFLVEPERSEINDKLWEQSWDVLFFAGHSETEGETGKIYINSKDSLTLDELRYGLKKAIAGGLKLAIFNSCDGLALAKDLAELRLPQGIVMREPVADRVAQEFLKYFLQAFSGGESLYLAVRQAREKLQGLERQFPSASLLPVICQNPARVPPSWQELLQPQPQESKRLDIETEQPISFWRRLGILALASLASTGATMGLRWFGYLEAWELLAFDHFMGQRQQETIDPRILVVEVTQEDASQYLYPLPDDLLSQAIATLEKAKPAAIGLDMHRYQARGEGRQDFLARFEENSNLVGVCLSNSWDNNYAPPPELKRQQIKSQMGFSDLLFDEGLQQKGRTIRRQILSYNLKLSTKPSRCITPYSFSLQLASRYLFERGIPIKVTENNEWQFGHNVFKKLPARTGGYQNLGGKSNQVLINYRANPKPAAKISLRQLLEGSLDADLIEGRIVLIGHDSQAAEDYFDTPLGKLPGVWIHAHQVSQILSAAIDERPLLWVLPQWGEFQWGDALWVWVWALTGGAIAWRFRSLLDLKLAGIAATIVLYYICLAIMDRGGWMPFVPSAMVLMGTGMIFDASYKTRKQQ